MGLLVWLFTVSSVGWFAGLFLALIATVLLARTLIWASCSGHPAMDGSDWQPDPVVAPTLPMATVPPIATVPVVTVDDSASDDLKKIKGVGPKLEEVLHENGIIRFAQIAAWDEVEIDRFVGIVGRMGSRIRSDDWVGQAKLLAAGGETEHSRNVARGEG